MKKETEGRKGRADGQPAHTRETKLGCVFTQTRWGTEGYAIRDPDSITYTGAIETAEEFGKSMRSLEPWLELRGKEGPHGRRSRMDLESGGCTLFWRCADGRCLSRAAAFVGLGSHTIPQ